MTTRSRAEVNLIRASARQSFFCSVVYGVAVATGELLGDGALTAGEAAGREAAGEALTAGDAEGDAVVAGDAVILVELPATNFHSPLRRAKVSTKRYLPVISINLPSGILYLPFLISVCPVTTAASLSRTLTLRSLISMSSAVKAPLPMSFRSCCLLPTLPSG